MATTIVTKSGSGAPTASDLVAGELAVDLTNGRLYTEDSGGTVLELGLNPNGNVDVTGSVTASGTLSANNIRVGVALDAWGANSHVIQMGDGVSDNGALAWNTISGADYFDLMYQSYFDGTDYKYAAAAAVSRISQRNGAITFDRKAAGSADATFTWDNSLTIDTSGNVGIGTSSPSSFFSGASNLVVSGGSGNGGITIDAGTSSVSALHFADGTSGSETYRGYVSYDHSSDALLLGTSGTEAMRIDSSGNVGIGVAPATGVRLDIRSNAAATIGDFRNASATGFGLYVAAGDTSSQYAFRAADYQNNLLFTVQGDGHVGIGTVPATELHVASPSDSNAQIRINGNTSTVYSRLYSDNNGVLAISTDVGNQVAGSYMMFEVKGTERMRIDASGNLLVGTSSVLFSNRSLQVKANGGNDAAVIQSTAVSAKTLLCWNNVTSGDNQFIAFLTEAGGTQRGLIDYNRAAGQVRYNITSDARLKGDIQNAEESGSLIDSIQVRQYDLKETSHHVGFGFIAQELLEVAPEAVHQPEDPEEMMGVDYSKLVPMMLKEIQSLRARIAALES